MVTDNEEYKKDLAALRRRAEERLAHPPDLSNEPLRLLHELQVHRVELELQNAELRDTRYELETMLEKYTDLFDFAPVGYVTLDRTGVILAVNLTAARLIGLERFRIRGRRFEHFVDYPFRPAFYALLQKAFLSATQESCEVNLMPKAHSGVVLQLKALVTVTGEECRLALIDITELKQAKQDLRETQQHKMETLGHMAGGVAHSFNNNLAIILGNIDLSLNRLAQDSPARPLLANAKIAVNRSRELVQKISTFSRQGSDYVLPVSLPALVDETLKLLESTIPSTVKLQKIITHDRGEIIIKGDATQIQEALINLCNNAVHAMREKGDLCVSLDRVTLQTAEIPAAYACGPGSYARLSVQDTGAGVPPEIIEQIFEPFFTTKGVNAGTGIGLATTQKVVMKHGGLIKVNSTPGQGSTFELYFPIIEDRELDIPAVDLALPRGSEKVLIVDDDSMLLEAWREILSEYGYQVTTQVSSTRALEIFKADPYDFDLVISDQTMPGLSGHEFIAELHGIRPDLPTILCTGHSNLIDAEEAKRLGINAFCLKPLALAEMVQVTRRVLDEEQAASGQS
ncbi:hybrid sensor histidine kinase/response regulator [Geopsychrobacter electrodiphilus]|uniref:hybrid sensor histidine kinase/response regulator n=1 Tax=Geopsychrobacter electrodiphilus TaxID=225196 RepID=UPI00037EB9FF|nr:PAS domain-containing sensor histidine kinase [Geopsychrobacter electrodiphilus]